MLSSHQHLALSGRPSLICRSAAGPEERVQPVGDVATKPGGDMRASLTIAPFDQHTYHARPATTLGQPTRAPGPTRRSTGGAARCVITGHGTLRSVSIGRTSMTARSLNVALTKRTRLNLGYKSAIAREQVDRNVHSAIFDPSGCYAVHPHQVLRAKSSSRPN